MTGGRGGRGGLGGGGRGLGGGGEVRMLRRCRWVVVAPLPCAWLPKAWHRTTSTTTSAPKGTKVAAAGLAACTVCIVQLADGAWDWLERVCVVCAAVSGVPPVAAPSAFMPRGIAALLLLAAVYAYRGRDATLKAVGDVHKCVPAAWDKEMFKVCRAKAQSRRLRHVACAGCDHGDLGDLEEPLAVRLHWPCKLQGMMGSFDHRPGMCSAHCARATSRAPDLGACCFSMLPS